MNNPKEYKSFLSILLPQLLISSVTKAQQKDSFLLSSPEAVAELIVNEKEKPVVHTACELFSSDVYLASGKRLAAKPTGKSN